MKAAMLPRSLRCFVLGACLAGAPALAADAQASSGASEAPHTGGLPGYEVIEAPAGIDKLQRVRQKLVAPRAPASAPDKAGKIGKIGKTGEAASPAAVRSAPSSCLLPAGFTAVKNGLALHEVLPEAGKGGALDEAAGKPVLLNLWAIWCAPCRVELPALDRLATARKDMVVQTLNLSDAPAGIAALFAKMNIRALPQTRSDDVGLPARLGAAGLPFTALFVDGRQVASRSGIVTSTEAVAAFAQCHAARAAAPGRPR